jgi:hypothetical protein
MPTLFHHEIQSYRTELKQLQGDAQEIATPGAVDHRGRRAVEEAVRSREGTHIDEAYIAEATLLVCRM